MKTVGTLAAMDDVQPFRAVRYSGAAGSLADLVAPPYDAVDEGERARLLQRSPYNVAHLTLPESIETAARLYRDWLAEGILERDAADSMWVSVETYVGPDGVERSRRGLVASLPATPYAAGRVLPHERTHPRIRDDRLELLRATRVQPEAILLLADSALGVAVPESEPDVAIDGTRLWRVHAEDVLAGAGLVIADGHHRYESAVELGNELGTPLRIMGLVLSTRDPGLHVFPTHRYFAGRPDLEALREGEPCPDLDDALRRLGELPRGQSAAIAYRRRSVELVLGPEGDLDTALVDRHGLDGIRYTPRADEATAAVDDSVADVAFILRQPRVDEVFALARRGERMPQKSTYFYPKPLSGLLFHPLDA
jgi:uncharacterized protein (DUF1015 family)